MAVAASEIHELDERRKALAVVNPLLAKSSELPPRPEVENITFEHISLNLPVMAKNALDELNGNTEEPEESVPATEDTVQDTSGNEDDPYAGIEPEDFLDGFEDEDEGEEDDEEEDGEGEENEEDKKEND